MSLIRAVAAPVVFTACVVLVSPAFTDPGWAQQYPSSLGHDDLGPWNQAPYDVEVVDDRAYTADLTGLTVYDISDPSSPEQLGQCVLPTPGVGLALSGAVAYVVAGDSGLHLLDISDPYHPTLTASTETWLGSSQAVDVAVCGNTAVVADEESGLYLFDVTDPFDPNLVGQYGDEAIGVSANGATACFTHSNVLEMIDVADPADPASVGSCQLPTGGRRVAVADDRAYVTTAAGVSIVDMSEPHEPTLLGNFSVNPDQFDYGHNLDEPMGLAVAGSIAYVADTFWGLQIIDVSDPAQPRLVGNYDYPRPVAPDAPPFGPRGVALAGSTVVVSAQNAGLRLVGVGDFAAPTLVASYAASGSIRDFEIRDSVVFAVTMAEDALRVISIDDIAEPAPLGYCAVPEARGVAVAGSTALVAAMSEGLQIVDVTDPSTPSVVATYDPGEHDAYDVTRSGSTAYVAVGDGMQVVDVSDPYHPQRIGELLDGFSSATTVALHGTELYVAGLGSLYIVDVADALNPELLAQLTVLSQDIQSVAASNGLVFVGAWGGVGIVDVSNPQDPVKLTTLPSPGYEVGVGVSGSSLYIADSHLGLRVFDVSEADSPKLITVFDVPGNASGVEAYGDYAIVSAQGFLDIVDVSTLSQPVELRGVHQGAGYAENVLVSDSVAYIADRDAGVLLVDVSDPLHTALLGTIDTGDYPRAMAVEGLTLYVAEDNAVEVFDVADPSDPAILGQWAFSGASDIAVSGSYLYAVSRGDGLTVADCSSPSDIHTVGSCETIGYRPRSIAVSGSTACILQTGSLEVIDLTDPTAPTLLAEIETGYGTYEHDVRILDHMAYVVDGLSLHLVDISSPAEPDLINSFQTGSGSALAVHGAFAITAGTSKKLRIFDVSSPTHPFLVKEVSLAQWGQTGVDVDPDMEVAWVSTGAVIEGVDIGCGGCSDLRIETTPSTLATGGETASVIVTVHSNSGQPIAGQEVLGQTTLGTLSPFTDNGDGTYLGTLTSGSEPGTAVITVSVNATPCSAQRAVVIADSGPDLPPVQDPGEWAYLIPASAHVAGLAGTNWVSDVVFHNPGTEPVEATVFFLRRDHDNSQAEGRRFTVPAEASVLARDVVGEMFGKPHGTGALLVGSEHRLHVTSRTYNHTTGGTFGQFIPALSTDRATTSGNEPRLIQLTGDENFRTNIGFVNATGQALAIELALLRSDGSSVADDSLELLPYGCRQLNDILPAGVHNAYAVVTSSTPGAGYFTYASVVDNRSGDPIFVLPAASPATRRKSLGTAFSTVRPRQPLDAHPTTAAQLQEGSTTSAVVALMGAHACVASSAKELSIVDVSDPHHPQVVGSCETAGSARDIVVAGSTVYITERDPDGLEIIDVSDPTQPQPIGSYSPQHYCYEVEVAGTTAYLTTADTGLRILDVTDPSAPVLLSSYRPPDWPDAVHGLAIRDSTAYLSGGENLCVVDVSDPVNPAPLGSYSSSFWWQMYSRLSVAGDLVYAVGSDGLEIVDFSDPSQPDLVAAVDADDGFRDVALYDSRACLLQSGGWDSLPLVLVLDVSDPSDPVVLDRVQTANAPVDVVLSGSTAYVTVRDVGLRLIDHTFMGVPHQQYVPAAAHVGGVAGTRWRTDLELHNSGDTPASLRLQALPRNGDNFLPLSASLELPARTAVRHEDVLDSLFGLSGAAALRIVPDHGSILAGSRTYNDATTGTYGQMIPSFPVPEAIGSGEMGRLTQLAASISTSRGYRTNIGLLNVCGLEIEVVIDLCRADGTCIAARTVSLQPYEHRQLDGVYENLINADLEDGYARLTSSTEDARFLAYASVVDNRSGDPIYVPAAVIQEQ